jgi:benzodiazapine receptor
LSDVMKLVISLVACFTAAGIGSAFTFKSIPTWYAGLKKPRYTPPNWAFGPIWSILYVMMAISVFFTWQNGLTTCNGLVAFTLFWTQLAFNIFWSIIFFGMKSRGGGVLTIVILWLLILATILTSLRVSLRAGVLLIPYIIWVTIATYLNIGVWLLNRSAKEGVAK